MIGLTSGVHRASSARATRRRSRLVLAVTLAALATTVAATTASAATTRVGSGPDGAVALTTTTVDKPWYSVEQFSLGLLNCTRTGGWILSDGTCRGYGTGHYSAYVRPLVYSTGLSDKVSRPYAKLLAVKGQCSHYLDGDPGYRIHRAGYPRNTWGENIGCRDGYTSAKSAVLASFLAFQGEKATNGGHWKNIKNPSYQWVGIGIWRYGTRTRLVVDFYG